MPWARIDDGFDEHTKIESLLDEEDPTLALAALGLWLLGLTRAHREMQGSRKAKNKNPGLVQRSNIRRYTSRENREEIAGLLVKYGLWESHDDGWMIHDFSDYLPSTKTSEARSEAGKKGAKARWGKEDADGNEPSSDGNEPSSDGNEPEDEWQTMARARRRGGSPEPEVQRPTTKVKNFPLTAAPLGPSPDPALPGLGATKVRRRKVIDDPRFTEFWEAYPRRLGKGDARKAWTKQLGLGVDPAVMIAGALRYAETRRNEDPEYTPYPSTWLNGERWTDEPADRPARRPHHDDDFWNN